MEVILGVLALLFYAGLMGWDVAEGVRKAREREATEKKEFMDKFFSEEDAPIDPEEVWAWFRGKEKANSCIRQSCKDSSNYQRNQ